MAEENLTIDLTSRADVSGFRQFEQASKQMNSAKREGREANGLLEDSERRVKSAFEESVMYMGNARNAADALGQTVMHLSEAFKLGFAGSVIAGVAGAVIEAFSRVDEALEKTNGEIQKTSDSLDALLEKATNKKANPQDAMQRELDTLTQQTEAQEKETSSTGFFKMLELGFSNMLGSGEMGKELQKQREDLEKAHVKELQIQTAIGQARGDALAKEGNDAVAHFAAVEAKMRARNGSEGLRQFGEQAQAQERAQDQAKETAAKNARASAEAKKQADDEAKRAAAEKARQAKEASEASMHDARREIMAESHGARLHVVAGAQRAIGGGGGAYSVVEDPAVAELRKQTMLLQEIAAYGKVQASAPAPLARAA